jgi:hypothetical protein
MHAPAVDAAKFLIAVWESTLVGRGWTVREIRRFAGAIAATVAIPCGIGFAFAPTASTATICCECSVGVAHV